MKAEYLNFDDRDRPYSQAVRVGALVYTSGAAVGDSGDDIETQTEKTLQYLSDVLRQAGTDLRHVVKATVCLADIGEWARFNEVWKRYFPESRPARTTTEGRLARAGAKVEVDFVAVVPDEAKTL